MKTGCERSCSAGMGSLWSYAQFRALPVNHCECWHADSKLSLATFLHKVFWMNYLPRGKLFWTSLQYEAGSLASSLCWVTRLNKSHEPVIYVSHLHVHAWAHIHTHRHRMIERQRQRERVIGYWNEWFLKSWRNYRHSFIGVWLLFSCLLSSSSSSFVLSHFSWTEGEVGTNGVFKSVLLGSHYPVANTARQECMMCNLV